MKKEIIEYDNLTLYVKKTKAEDVVKHYHKFGWELVSNEENKRYEDIVDLAFKRPHKIEEKDELQLLQVYMEENLNKTAKLERNKYSKTTAFALFFGVIGLTLFVLSVLNAVKVLNWYGLVTLIILGSVGLVFLIITAIFTPMLFKKDKINFNLQKNNLSEELSIICKKASILTGGKYE